MHLAHVPCQQSWRCKPLHFSMLLAVMTERLMHRQPLPAHNLSQHPLEARCMFHFPALHTDKVVACAVQATGVALEVCPGACLPAMLMTALLGLSQLSMHSFPPWAQQLPDYLTNPALVARDLGVAAILHI